MSAPKVTREDVAHIVKRDPKAAIAWALLLIHDRLQEIGLELELQRAEDQSGG